MPKWREKSDSVRMQGEIQRRDWNPRPDSVHLRMYQWWRARSSRAEDISRENFCHYWRVVMIWAPLRWLAPKLLALVVAAAIAALVIGIFVYGSMVAIGFGLGIYMMPGIYVTAYLTDKYLLSKSDTKLGNFALLRHMSRVPYALVVLATLPVIVFLGVPAVVVGLVVYIVYGLHVDHGTFGGLVKLGKSIKGAITTSVKATGRAIKWPFAAHFSEHIWLTWIRPYLIFPVLFAILGFWYGWAAFLSALMVAVIAGALLVLWLFYLADKSMEAHNERVEAAIRAESDVFFRNLFALQHPKYAGNELRYQKWFARYRKHIKDRHDVDVYEKYASYHFLFDRNFELTDKYTALYGRPEGAFLGVDVRDKLQSEHEESKKKRQPVVREFMAFVWSIVLVNKWKICPIVEIPERVQ